MYCDVDPLLVTGDINSYQIGAYVGWKQDTFYTNAAMSFGSHQIDTTRTINVGASVSTASADYDSVNVSTALEVGKIFNWI